MPIVVGICLISVGVGTCGVDMCGPCLRWVADTLRDLARPVTGSVVHVDEM